jgi:hypothetical protein
MCTTTMQQPPVTADDALGMMASALDLLAGTDKHAAAADLGEVIAALSALASRVSAVQAACLSAFDAAGGPEADGFRGMAAWLADRTQTTKMAAQGQAKWSRMLTGHPAISAAMAAGQVSESFGRKIAEWTRDLPAEMRETADKILLTAAAGGCTQRDLALLVGKIWDEYRQQQPDPDDPVDTDPDGDRSLFLGLTTGGAGKLTANLTPTCAAALQAVLEAMAKHRGADDDRTLAQRNHDALEEALAVLLRSRLVPQRAGQDTHTELIIDFATLRNMPGASALEEKWLAPQAGEAVRLTGKAAQAAACDTALIPVVTGHADWTRIDRIIEITLGAIRHDSASRPDKERSKPLTAGQWAAIREAIAQQAIAFVSGPGGLAATLRQALTNLPGPSLPLDVGFTLTIPAHLRRAVILRDRHCAWGGCYAPPAWCEVHHIVHKKDGGETSVTGCVLLCKFHHQVMIHRRGWTITLLADGTTEARSPQGKVVRSHSPPVRSG